MHTVGIDKIGVYVPQHYVAMTDLAQARGIDSAKLTVGIGQDRMAITTLQEDIVTMAVNAALQIIDDEDRLKIDQIIVATESSFDYSKSAATYLHELLNVQPFAKAYELKQACYGATAGLQMACDYVRLRPERKVLVIASDIAKYGLNTPGEATQGAGAVALLVTANPRIMALELPSVSYTSNQYDFWRPSYSDVAFVDGKFSTELYQSCFAKVMTQFCSQYFELAQSLEAMLFHLPFSKMGQKALTHYAQQATSEMLPSIERWQSHYQASTLFGRQVGNIYTGSLYLSLVSLLANDSTLKAGQSIGLFSYGSGAVAELFVGTLCDSFREQITMVNTAEHIARCKPLSISQYEDIYQQTLPSGATCVEVGESSQADGAYLSHIDAHRRYYRLKP